jgi:hypothetical protein
MDPKEVMSYLKLGQDSNIYESRLIKIFCHVGKIEEKLDHNVMPSHDYGSLEKHFEFFHDIIIKTRQEYPNKLLLNIMGTNIAQKINRYREINGIDMLPFVRANTDLSLIVSRHSRNTREYLSEISDVHMRLLILNGSLFLQSLIPWGHLYAVLPNTSPGSTRIKLDPVV